MATLSELKRMIKPGLKIKLIDTNMLNHKWLNIPRVVSKVQTNGFYMATKEQSANNQLGSFVDFPKASDLNFPPPYNIFTFYMDYMAYNPAIGGEREFLTYQIS